MVTSSVLIQRASEASEADYQSCSIEISDNWRASVASETVLGVDNAKSGICYYVLCMWDGTYDIETPFPRT